MSMSTYAWLLSLCENRNSTKVVFLDMMETSSFGKSYKIGSKTIIFCQIGKATER